MALKGNGVVMMTTEVGGAMIILMEIRGMCDAGENGMQNIHHHG